MDKYDIGFYFSDFSLPYLVRLLLVLDMIFNARYLLKEILLMKIDQ